MQSNQNTLIEHKIVIETASQVISGAMESGGDVPGRP